MSASQKIALIGVGGHGASHLQTIRVLESAGQVKLCAVADPFVERLTEDYAVLTSQGVAWYRDYREMLHQERALDAVVISTPIHLHGPMVQDVLSLSRARILLEKPAFPTIQQLDQFIAADPENRVRVGFQMIHWPGIKTIRNLLLSGRAGTVQRILVSAGWVRPAAYYQRAPWAGRLMVQGEPVFDGPATNAMAHLLHSALFLAGSETQRFAAPDQVEAGLYRSRAIESYDAAWLRASLGSVELQIALAHCVKDHTPYVIRVETDRGVVTFSEEGLKVENSMGFDTAVTLDEETDKLPLYRSFLSGLPEPSTLADVRPYTVLTNAALAASGGIHSIPGEAVVWDAEIEDVTGLTEYLRSFYANPRSPHEAGFAWAPATAPVATTAFHNLDLALLQSAN